MWNDVVDLRDFYDSRLGQMARRLIRRRVRALWPDVPGQAVLGLGYATPYLRQFHGEAERVLAIMPAGQGVLPWPPEGPNAVALADETELPLPDRSVDRVLLVHGLECGEQVRDMLREVWRVMAGSGRLLVVAPNRRGIWARSDRTPFGQGQPYSPPQLSRLLRDNMFTPIQSSQALFMPPTRSDHAAAHRAGLGAHRPALVPALRRRRDDGGGQAALCRHDRARQAPAPAGRRRSRSRRRGDRRTGAGFLRP